MAKAKSKKIAVPPTTFKPVLRILPFILIGAFLVFSPALSNEFVNWDDYAYIVDNTIIKDLSIDNILHIFNFNTHVVGNYHPLTVLSYAIEYQLAGVKPFLYHLDNMLLHLLNIFLLSVLVWKLTKHQYAVIIAACLFAIHPMRVESVVWAAERKDVLYTFFFFLSLLFYIRFLLSPNQKTGNYLLCLLFFLLSVLSKGQAVVLPLVLILLDYWFSDKITTKNLVRIIPFFILAIAFGLLATNAQSSSLTAERLIHYEFYDRIFFASYNLLAYPFKFLFPYQLACFYGYPLKSDMFYYYLCLPAVLIIFSYVLYKFRKNKLVIFSTLFFLFTVFIVIQLLPIGNAIMADRYSYIPYVGFFILVGELLNRLIIKRPKLKNIILTIITLQLIVFGYFSFNQARTWKNSESLWKQALKVNPREPVALNNLGAYFYEKGNSAASIPLFLKCIENSENYLEVYKAYSNLGGAYKNANKPDSALMAYDKSIELQPAFTDAVFGKGLVLTDMKQFDKAVNIFTELIKTDPNNERNYYSRAIAYRNMNNIDEAIKDYQNAIRINPQYADAYTNLGNIYFNLQNLPLAIDNYTKSLKIRPDGNSFLNRSKAFFFLTKYKEALDDYNKATQYNVAEAPFLEVIKSKMNGSN